MNSQNESKEVWGSGDSYEPYVGRWSRLVAREFIRWLALPENGHWLDVGCGTGALSQTILELANPKKVKGLDRSEDYAEFARSKVIDPRAEFEVGNAQMLPLESGGFDAAVSGLASAPNFTVQLRPLLSSTMIFSEVPDDDLLTNVNLSEGFGAASRPPRP